MSIRTGPRCTQTTTTGALQQPIRAACRGTLLHWTRTSLSSNSSNPDKRLRLLSLVDSSCAGQANCGDALHTSLGGALTSLSIHDSVVSLGLSLRRALRFLGIRMSMSFHTARQGRANQGDDGAALTGALALQRLAL